MSLQFQDILLLWYRLHARDRRCHSIAVFRGAVGRACVLLGKSWVKGKDVSRGYEVVLENW
jgi:hypothetical protein